MEAKQITDNEYQSEGTHSMIKVKKMFTLADYMNEKQHPKIMEWLNLIKRVNKESEEVKE